MRILTNQRSLLTTLAAIVLFATGCQCSRQGQLSTSQSTTNVVATPPPTKQSQKAMSPRQAVAELRAGNARFVSGHPLVRNSAADIKATASGQYPIAVVLSCIDSRKPIEEVLDQGIGGIFSARIAGNIVNEDILGSMEFACKVSGAKAIAVIGHSDCGAIKGAVDNVQLGNLTGLLARVKPAIEQVPGDVQPRNSKNDSFVAKVAEANVRLVMKQIRERSSILREMLDRGEIGLVGGVYDLSTGEINFYGN